MAEDGDTIEVDDGFYFEKNIIIDKKIHLKSKNLFGAVIDGGKVLYSSIFLIRSQTEIEGFVLKNSYYGILQRNSPDVLWVAHDMAILDMLKGAIYINDRDRNIGSASVKNILVDNSKTAFLTNDANRLEVTNCLVTNCFVVFNGSNHIDFSVNKISILNCEKITFSGGLIVEPTYPATHQINLGPEIHILDDIVKTNAKPNLKSAISTIFPAININRSDGLNNHNLDSMTLDVLGEVYLRLGDYDKATDLFQTAVSVGENTGSLDIVWDSYYGLAKISESQHRYQKALEYYEKSILAIENVRNKLPLMEYKTAYMKSRMKVYESL
ncbi:MAG: tetratricopeptide repeat protein, partial [Candidatus Thorarchaeota archaeon]